MRKEVSLFKSHRRLFNGTLASLQTRSRLQRLTSSFMSPGVFKNGVTCSVVNGLFARLSLFKLSAPRNISGCKIEMILLERSNSRRDERRLKNPLGKLLRRLLARFSRVIAGISSNVFGLRLSRPQFAHSKRKTLLNNDNHLAICSLLILF